MITDELRIIADGYFAGENVSDEIKEAWIKGVLFGIRNHSAFTLS